MFRFLPITILAAAMLAQPGLAKDDAAQGNADVKKLAPSELRAVELDRLFGQLHGDNPAQVGTVEQKIWANWSRNDSVTAEVLLGQATSAMGAQEFNAAEDILDQLIAAQPAYAEALNRRATLHFMARRYEKSLADIDKVLELEPRHFGALAGRAMIYEALGKPDEALAAYREALSVNPHMAGAQEAVRRLEKERPEI